MFGETYHSRLKNSRRNLFAGLFRQIMTIVLSFIIRTVIIYTLGAEYQGLSGLFTSILQVLNLTELGFSASVTYILYKPIAENDKESICEIIAFLKKIYKCIGIVILVVGIGVMPFLKYFIYDGYPEDINLYVLFGIYLLNAVVSYCLFAYKNSLLTALQRMDLVSNAYTISNFAGKVIQIIILILFRNYYVYALLIPVTSIINNILLEIMSREVFPEIIPKGVIKQETKNQLMKQIKAVFINRIGDIARNSFDNIVISSYLGLMAVAVYDNYFYIYSALYGIMGIVVQSLKASIGNSLIKENVSKNYQDMLKFAFIFMWMGGWCTVCLVVLYQPFMLIWMQNDSSLLLPIADMLLFCLYFYTMSMAYTKNAYLEAYGLFHESRYLYIFEAVANLLLNILLCKYFGVTGVLIATVITIVLFNFVGGTIILFKTYFKRSSKKFALYHLLYFIVTVFACWMTAYICEFVSAYGILNLIIRLIICIFIPNLIYIVTYCKLPFFSSTIDILRGMLKRIIS